jgi:capreomycidine synthase
MQTLGRIAPALLEDWFRTRYFTARFDISCSGMPPYRMSRLRETLGPHWPDLDDIDLRDSPSLGGDRLRHAIAGRFAPARADRVMVTTGSSEAIFLALAALVRPGDEVVVLRPAYQSLCSIAEALGARLRHWELDPADDFRPDLDRLKPLLGPATKAVVVNFPHNPTGTTLTAEQYGELLGLVDRHGCHLVWDGAFAELTYDTPALPDPATALDRCVSTGTLSKSYGLPGLRVGWCLAPPELLTDMVKVHDYITLNVCPVNEAIAAAVLEQGDRFIDRHRAQARRGRDVVQAWARRHTFSVPVPLGGVTAFAGLPDGRDATALAARLAEEDGVLVAPGHCFGQPGRMRIGFGGPLDELRHGLDRLTARAVC